MFHATRDLRLSVFGVSHYTSLAEEPLHDANDEPLYDAPAGCRHAPGDASWPWGLLAQHCTAECGDAEHDSCDGDSESWSNGAFGSVCVILAMFWLILL